MVCLWHPRSVVSLLLRETDYLQSWNGWCTWPLTDLGLLLTGEVQKYDGRAWTALLDGICRPPSWSCVNRCLKSYSPCLRTRWKGGEREWVGDKKALLRRSPCSDVLFVQGRRLAEGESEILYPPRSFRGVRRYTELDGLQQGGSPTVRVISVAAPFLQRDPVSLQTLFSGTPLAIPAIRTWSNSPSSNGRPFIRKLP